MLLVLSLLLTSWVLMISKQYSHTLHPYLGSNIIWSLNQWPLSDPRLVCPWFQNSKWHWTTTTFRILTVLSPCFMFLGGQKRNIYISLVWIVHSAYLQVFPVSDCGVYPRMNVLAEDQNFGLCFAGHLTCFALSWGSGWVRPSLEHTLPFGWASLVHKWDASHGKKPMKFRQFKRWLDIEFWWPKKQDSNRLQWLRTTYKELRWSRKFDFRCFDDVANSNILKQSKSRMILYCVVSLLIQDPRQYLQRVSWMVAPPWVSFLPSSLWSATLLNQPSDGDDYSQSLLSHCALTPPMGVSRYFRWYDQRFWRHLHRADENLGRMASSSLGTSSEDFRLQNPWLGSLDLLKNLNEQFEHCNHDSCKSTIMICNHINGSNGSTEIPRHQHPHRFFEGVEGTNRTRSPGAMVQNEPLNLLETINNRFCSVTTLIQMN